jgi:hypothetical protein
MYRVEWLETALDELATIWVQSNLDEREAVTSACQSVETRLRNNPSEQGESRSGRRRIAFFPPLVISFQIELDGETVTVLNVRMFKRRGN